MVHFWPGFLAVAVPALSYGYGKWRRDRGCPITGRERLWLALSVPAICLPALALPPIATSEAMTPSDRVISALLVIGLGSTPLAIGACFFVGLGLTRRYVARTRAKAAARAAGNPWDPPVT